MPFNRVHKTKMAAAWMEALRTAHIDDGRLSSSTTGRRSVLAFRKSVSPSRAFLVVPTYYPGFNLIPLPGAGLFGIIDFAFWALAFYFAASLVSLIDSIYQAGEYGGDADDDDPSQPGNYLNLVASVLFLTNSLICVVDWWLQRQMLSMANIDYNPDSPDHTHLATLEGVGDYMSMFYLYNNIAFCAAAITSLIQAIIMTNADTDLTNCGAGTFCNDFWLSFLTSIFYLYSAYFSVLETFENYKMRRYENLPPLKACSSNVFEVDWFAWGDFVMVAASLLPLIQTFMSVFGDFADAEIQMLNIVGSLVFLVDSMLYMVGYALFVYELRESLKAGLLSRDHAHAVVSSALQGQGQGTYMDGPDLEEVWDLQSNAYSMQAIKHIVKNLSTGGEPRPRAEQVGTASL